jgi:hypothetical protein
MPRAPDRSRALVAAAGASTFLKKKLAKFGALKTSNPQLQLALLPENEVLPSVQINLFARLAPAEYYARTGQNGMCWWAAG